MYLNTAMDSPVCDLERHMLNAIHTLTGARLGARCIPTALAGS